MRCCIMKLFTATILAALPVVALAAPPTEQQKFEKKVERFTNSNAFINNPKRLCVCVDDNNPDDVRMAGVLVDTLVAGGDGLRRIQVRCFVRRFTAAGNNTSAEACSSTWVLLR